MGNLLFLPTLSSPTSRCHRSSQLRVRERNSQNRTAHIKIKKYRNVIHQRKKIYYEIMKRGWARYQRCRCWQVCLVYLTCNIQCNRCGSRTLRSSSPASNIRNRILVSIHASFRLFRANVPCCCTWQSDCGGGSELISLLTRHSILVADWSRVYLVHTSCVLEGDPVVRRYTISIDFSAVVATAPPRYHLVALLLYTSRPRSSRIPPFRVSQSALLRHDGADGAI